MNHLQCRDDFITIFFHKSKTNQDGLDKNFLRHIHVYLILPEYCPVHDMGANLFTNTHIINNNSRHFPGEHQYRRYSYLLKKIIEDKKEHLANYVSVENLGSHSIRKGAASYCSSGITVPPSVLSICLRAGWKISCAKELCLEYENYGDQFMSRLVCGLNSSSPEFTISPPHFETTNK